MRLLAPLALVFACSCTDGTDVGPAGPGGATGEPGSSCTVIDNGNGTKTIKCTDGSSVTVSDSSTALGVKIPDLHGRAFLAQEALTTAGKFYAKATITSATADAAGLVTVNFSVADKADKALPGLSGMSFNVAKLVPAPAGEVSNHWTPYIMRSQTVSDSATGGWPGHDGDTANQGNRETNGTLTDHGDGTYVYVYATRLDAAKFPVDGSAIVYDRTLLHRVSLMMGGRSGPTASATFDFVPDGSTTTEKREIVSTNACKECHGPEFAAHGGDRLSVENCATCHGPDSFDPHSGETIDLKVMIHKIHAGGVLDSIPGADGIVFDNPATPVDESADNGSYAIWGYNNTKAEWWKVEFPAVPENCTKCHAGTGAQVDNWKNKPSRAACGSCHDTTYFGALPVPAGMVVHAGGTQLVDTSCAACHPASGTLSAFVAPVTQAHDWMAHDQRNIPEFTADLTVSTPANGQFFVAGETPVVTLVLKKDGAVIDHTTMVQDDVAEGCPPDAATGKAAVCPDADGKFMVSSLFVHGPRARRNPVLTTAARARVLSAENEPFNLGAAGANLVLKVDGGEDLFLVVNGADKVLRGTITVAVPATGVFANKAAATHAELVAWLNANADFKARAIAYLDNGKVAIRSRNLGKAFGVQLQPSVVTTAVFGGDVTLHLPTGSTVVNKLAKQTPASASDPKVTLTAGSATYTLDPVDDLKPGTYIASVEIADRGRVDAVNYKTPTVAKIPFQVGQEAVEKPIANSCNSCHQNSEGQGFILDPARHNKIFSDTAVDQCGACHDYQSGATTAASPANWVGAGAIARRVHAVHNGANLNFPLSTVGYANGDPVPGRNWDITFPQDIRNCEACHADGTTSGTWQSKPGRIACIGCHDSEAAQNHLRAQTWDPTPAQPYSGDEGESCATCH